MQAIKYIFINPEVDQLGGISTFGNFLIQNDPNAHIFCLHPSKIVHEKIFNLPPQHSHSCEAIVKALLNIIQSDINSNWVLIPNIGASTYEACCIVKKNLQRISVGLLGIMHNHHINTLEWFKYFDPWIDQFMTLSKSSSNLLSRQFPEKIPMIHMLLPTFFKPSSFKYTKPKGPIKLLFFSRLSYFDKNLYSLKKIITLLVSGNVSFKLGIIGDGEAKDDLQNLVFNELHLSNVIFHGALHGDILHKTIRSYDCVLQLSPSEGFGLATYEAMLSGLVPIMYETQTGLQAHITPHKDYIPIPLGNEVSLVQAVKNLANNPTKLSNLQKNAYLKALQINSSKTFLKNFKMVLQKCLKNKTNLAHQEIKYPEKERLEAIIDQAKQSPSDSIAIYGGGEFGKKIVDRLNQCNISIALIIDKSIKSSSYKNIPYYHPNQVDLSKLDTIIIGSYFFGHEIKKHLLSKQGLSFSGKVID